MDAKKKLLSLRDILKFFFPESRLEIFVFLAFFTFYLSYSIFIALNSSVIDFTERPYDVYFSYDNPIVYERGYVYISGHPLMRYITMPFILLGDFLANLFGYKAKTILCVFICSLLVSLSIIYICRYLKKIIKLRGSVVYILLGMYGFSMTCLTLCFTPESFTISVFLLSFTVCIYSCCIHQNKKMSLAATIFFQLF